jgi:hypothetical protein
MEPILLFLTYRITLARRLAYILAGSLKIHIFLRCFPRIKIPHHPSVFPWFGLNIITPQLSQIFCYEEQFLCLWPPRSSKLYVCSETTLTGESRFHISIHGGF